MTIDMAGKPGSYRPPAAPGWKPLGPRRAVTAQSMRKLAKRLDTEHPLMNSGQHLRDAANALEDGNHEGAQRHLTAAIGNMTPQSLRRHGMLDDASHNMAKSNMDAVHRHLLLVKDIADTHAQNQALINRVSTEDNNRPAQDTGGADPQHLPQTPRQPAGNQAVNAPRNLGTGGPDQSIAKPKQITSPQITKQIAASQSGDLTTAIELVGPKGFIHGWIHVGAGHADLSQHSADDVARVAAHHPDPAARQAAKAELKKRMGLGQRVGAAIAKNLREGNEGSDLPSGPGQHGDLYGQMDQAGDYEAIELGRHHFDSRQPRDKDGRWSATGASSPQISASSRYWHQGSEPPSRAAIAHHPDAARRMRLITPERVEQFRADDQRMSDGKKPLHPELADVWPQNYARAGVKPTGKLKEPRPYVLKPDKGELAGMRKPPVSPVLDTVRADEERIRAGQPPLHPELAALFPASYLKRNSAGTILPGQVAPRRLGAQVVGLSAETARLAVQPHPFGKPGGPGLWHVKDMELPPYVQNIAHALLRTGRARDEGSAIAMARAATKRWMHGVHTTPEVRAASTASDAEWRAGQARAHATR